MLPDLVSNPGALTYESGALPIALHGPAQGKVREFCGWSGKFRKDLETQGKVREFGNKWQWQADFRKYILSFQEGKRCTFS